MLLQVQAVGRLRDWTSPRSSGSNRQQGYRHNYSDAVSVLRRAAKRSNVAPLVRFCSGFLINAHNCGFKYLVRFFLSKTLNLRPTSHNIFAHNMEIKR